MSIAQVDRFNNCFAVFSQNTQVQTALEELLKRILIVIRTDDQSKPGLLLGSDLLTVACKSPTTLLSELGQVVPIQPINLGMDSNVSREPVLLLYTEEGIKIVWESREDDKPDPNHEPCFKLCPKCKAPVPVTGNKCLKGHTI